MYFSESIDGTGPVIFLGDQMVMLSTRENGDTGTAIRVQGVEDALQELSYKKNTSPEQVHSVVWNGTGGLYIRSMPNAAFRRLLIHRALFPAAPNYKVDYKKQLKRHRIGPFQT